MIIQTAPPNQPHLVISQIDHAHMSGQFAKAFGNDHFAPLTPAGALEYVATHHDQGWAETDSAVLQDPQTGLPYHLTQTPLSELIKTSAKSPTFNQTHHPLSGILSSMHTYGLFHGRYGLSDKIFIDHVPPAHKEAVATMLQAELDRQAALQTQLANEPTTLAWVDRDFLFHNYKLLQFFDTLALYFHMVHPAGRTTATFPNIPQSPNNDTTLTIQPLGNDTYTLTPYPFHTSGQTSSQTFHYQGRPFTPQPLGTDLVPLLAQQPYHTETVTLIAG